MFVALGVFNGTFSLERAETICETSLEVIGSLVDKSLVRRQDERLPLSASTAIASAPVR